MNTDVCYYFIFNKKGLLVGKPPKEVLDYLFTLKDMPETFNNVNGYYFKRTETSLDATGYKFDPVDAVASYAVYLNNPLDLLFLNDDKFKSCWNGNKLLGLT